MRMAGSTGCAGVMVSRPAIGAPWVFAEILAEIGGREFEPPDRREMVLDHFEASVEHYGLPRGVKEFRKHLVKYLRGIRSAASMRNRLVRMDDADDIRATLAGLDFSA